MRFAISIVFGIIITIIAICNVPVSNETRFNYLADDAIRIKKVYNRIVNNQLPIDIAFIGSSHTWNGVDDFGIESKLASKGNQIHVANLGIPTMGRDMQQFMVKLLLKYKSPKLVVIEINEHEPPYGHRLYPYIAGFSDLVCCGFYLDSHFPKSFLLFLKNQLRNFYNEKITFGQSKASLDIEQYGWMNLSGYSRSGEKYPELNFDAKENLKFKLYDLSKIYGIYNVKQMTDIIRDEGIKVSFLYLPEYKYFTVSPAGGWDSYTRLSPVITLPNSLGTNQTFWFDHAHLNTEGVKIVTPYLTTQLEQTLGFR